MCAGVQRNRHHSADAQTRSEHQCRFRPKLAPPSGKEKSHRIVHSQHSGQFSSHSLRGGGRSPILHPASCIPPEPLNDECLFITVTLSFSFGGVDAEGPRHNQYQQIPSFRDLQSGHCTALNSLVWMNLSPASLW
jgi:hypothetical protein